jgi:transcription elongation factor Elf1
MTNAGIINCSPYGVACTECNELIIAPERSEYVDKQEVRHSWSCENCGHGVEILIYLGINATA